MRTLRNALSALTAAALVVGGAGVATADNAIADGDGLTPVANSALAFGSVACGVQTSDTALVAVSRNGTATGTQTFTSGATVTVSVLTVSGAGLSAAMDATTITLPANWASLPNNTLSAAVLSTVTLTSTVEGAGSGSITFRATGLNSSGATISRDRAMSVSWTTGSCAPADATPPVITPHVSGALGTNGWYTSDVDLSWTVSDPESTVTSVSGCTATSLVTDTTGTTVTCAATSSGGTASQRVTIKRDATAPVIGYLGQSPEANAAGWNNTDVTLSWSCSDATSGAVAALDGTTLTAEGADQQATGTCTDNAGNVVTDTTSGVDIDTTAPVISHTVNPSGPDGDNGWYTSDVAIDWTVEDALSGAGSATGCADTKLTADTTGVTLTCDAADLAGNTATQTTTLVQRDATAPEVTWDNGGPSNGGAYYFGTVPAAPGCSATDATSGLAGPCAVTGYGTGVGTHTLSASAVDNAGNRTTQTRTYTVLAWTLRGFYQPVDMNGTYNVVKNGSTVPFKFEVFAGSTELTSTAAVQSFSATRIACPGTTAVEDPIEFVTTGATSLRYDATAGQFVQNWKTPTAAGTCYRVVMTTQDGSHLDASFKLK